MKTANICKVKVIICCTLLIFLSLWVMAPTAWAAHEVDKGDITADVGLGTLTKWTDDLVVRWTAPSMGADILNGYFYKWSESISSLNENDGLFVDFSVTMDGSVGPGIDPPNAAKDKASLASLDSGNLLYLHIITSYLDITIAGQHRVSADVIYGPFLIDNKVPVGTVRIVDWARNDISTTSDTRLNLEFSVAKDPVTMYLSETGNKPVTGTAYISALVWDLSDTTPGLKTISAWFEDSVGNLSQIATDSVTLLSTTTISPNTATLDLAASATQTFRVEGTDAAYTWSIIEAVPETSEATVAQIIGDGAAANSVTIQGLAKGTFKLQADPDSNVAGDELKSGTITVMKTRLAVVTGFVVTPQTNGNLKLDWTNPNDADFTGVIVVGATNAAPTLMPVDGTTYTVGKVGQDDILYVGNLQTYTETLAHGIHRYYKVFAYDAVKNYSPTAEANVTSSDTTPTAAPTAAMISAGNAQVTLAWTNPTDLDFAGIVILQKAVSAPTGVPSAGTTYTVGSAVGDATVAYAAYANKAATATITGLTNSTRYYFAIYAVDERPNYSATAASANAVPGPPVISAPALPANVHVGGTVAFTATSGVGSYAWTATGGSLSAATGASTTWTAPATVAASPTAYTVRVTNPTTGLYAEGVVNVYSRVAITGKPPTPPTVLSGMDSAAFSVAGGDSAYTWTVTGPVAVAGGTASSFIFKAPTTGAFAGEYTIKAADGKGGEDSFKVQVPFTLTPSSKAFKQNSPLTFTVGGVTGNITWDMMSKSDEDGTFATIATPGEYGTWANAGASDPTNVFTPAAGITEAKVFYLKILVDGYAYATAANGLNEQTFGPFQIIPVSLYTVNVLNGAVVAVRGQLDASGQPLKQTAVGGKVTFALPDGGKYFYDVSLANYVPQSVSSAEKTVNMTLTASTAAIAGTVTNSAGGAALAGAKVTAYLPATPAVQYRAMTDAAGTYAINLPTGAAATGWTVAASLSNFVAATQSGIASPAAGVNFGLSAMALGSPDVNAGGGSKTLTFAGQMVAVEVPAGGVATSGYITITPFAKVDTTAKATLASPTYVYDVQITDAVGAPLAAADIRRIVITLPLDLTVLKPGDLEAGRFVICMAATRAALESGSVTAIPVGNIISTDYFGNGLLGSVTFWVDHLRSFFSVGSVDAVPIPVSIVGYVINATALIPLPGATVTITKGADVFTATAQTDGRFSFSKVPSGTYNIEFASSDYWSLKGSVTVSEGATAPWNVVAIPNTMIAQIRSGYVTQEQLTQAVEANAAKDAIITQKDQTIASMFTKDQLDQSVAAERMKWDINGDGKMGLEVAISILQKLVGLRPASTASAPPASQAGAALASANPAAADTVLNALGTLNTTALSTLATSNTALGAAGQASLATAASTMSAANFAAYLASGGNGAYAVGSAQYNALQSFSSYTPTQLAALQAIYAAGAANTATMSAISQVITQSAVGTPAQQAENLRQATLAILTALHPGATVEVTVVNLGNNVYSIVSYVR